MLYKLIANIYSLLNKLGKSNFFTFCFSFRHQVLLCELCVVMRLFKILLLTQYYIVKTDSDSGSFIVL